MSEIADRDELLRLLTEAAREGSVSAQKELLRWHEVHEEEPPADDWAVIYGDGDNVTPLRRKSA